MASNDLIHVPARELLARFDEWSELDRERNDFIQVILNSSRRPAALLTVCYIQKLLHRLSVNESQIDQLKLDFEDQKRSRVHYQSEALRLEGELHDNEYRTVGPECFTNHSAHIIF